MTSNKLNEDIENQEKTKKKDPVELKQEFLSEFAWKNNSSIFISMVTKKTNIDEEINKEMLKLKASKDKYAELNLDSINIHELKRAFWKDIIKFKNAENLFISAVKKIYVINNDEELIKLIDWKPLDKIYFYINTPSELEKLLKDNLKNIEKVETKKLFSGIKWIKESDIEKRIKIKYSSNPEKIDEVMFIFQKIKNNTYNDSDIKWLFEFDILDFEWKKNLIDAYIPIISLWKALEIWLIDEKSAKEKKKILLTKYKDKKIDDDAFDEISSAISYDDIILKSKDLYNENNINLLTSNIWFKNLEQDFLSLKEEVKKQIIKNWPQNFDDLVILLDEINNNRFDKLEKLKKGTIIKYTTKVDNKPIITYVEISSIDDEKNEFGYKVIWEWSHISLDSTSKIEEKKTYVDFLEWLKQKSDIRFECFTQDEIKKQVKDWELIQNEFNNISLNDLNSEEKTKLTDKYIWWLEEEIRVLEQEINDSQDETIKKTKKKLLEQKQNNLNLYRNHGEDSSKVINKLRFIEKLDDIDPDWRNIWFWKWVLFQVENDIYEIVWFEDVIKLKHTISNKEETVELENFFTTFKEKKAKRIEKIENFSILIEKYKIDNKNWDNHEVKDWKLIAKWVVSWNKTWDKVVEYLVWDKTNDLIKINSINWNQVEIQFWERKNYSDLDEWYKNKNKIWKSDKWEIIFLDDRKFTITLSDLDNYIKADKLYPNWKTWKKVEPENIKDIQNKIGWSFISRYFRRSSINELLAWWKMLVDWIKETLKKWNSLHAAEFAMKIWKILPWDLWEDMKIMVERAQEEQQNKELESLWKVDSPIAVKRIKKWLLNKDTQEYKKEAAIIFMLDKYGHLTAKWPLYEFRWKRLWYEALGWRINDELFLEIKASAEASNITFSEEYLIHILLKRQCSWKLPPKRRSRLHKEYENKWKSWVAAEFDKWYSDAEKKRTARDITNWWHGEADTWTTSNAIWWYKKAVERGWSLEEMSEWFFALLFSGALYNVDQATFLKIKWLWDSDGMPIIMTRFSTNVSDMKLFNTTVVEICKRIEESKYPEHNWIYKEALDLFNEALSWKWSEGDRYKKTINFWKKHWTPIARALNMANVTDTKYSETDKIILFEKEKNPVFKNYYKWVRAYTQMTNTFKQGFMDEECWEVWLTGLNINEVTKKYLLLTTSMAFRYEKTWERVWAEISKDIKSTRNKKFVKNNDALNTIKQKEYLVHVLRDITSGILSVTWKWRMTPYNSNSSNIWKDFNNWKLNFENDLWDVSPDDILDGKADKLLLRTADNILRWWWNNEDGITNPLDELKATTKKSADNTLSQTMY